MASDEDISVMAFRRPHSVLSIHIAAADALYDPEEQSLKLFFLSGTLFKKEVGRQPFSLNRTQRHFLSL